MDLGSSNMLTFQKHAMLQNNPPPPPTPQKKKKKGGRGWGGGGGLKILTGHLTLTDYNLTLEVCGAKK